MISFDDRFRVIRRCDKYCDNTYDQVVSITLEKPLTVFNTTPFTNNHYHIDPYQT